MVHSVIRTPSGSPYSKARDALLRHFGRTPRQNARELREARSIGDKLPSEFLDHALGLLPDVKTYFEIILLDALPANARAAALQHTSLRAMAKAADEVVLENRALAEAERGVLSGVNAISLLDGDNIGGDVTAPLVPHPPAVTAVGRRDARPPGNGRRSDTLCSNHARWGKETYKCLAPRTCRLRLQLKPRPLPSSTPSLAPGNARAGGQ